MFETALADPTLWRDAEIAVECAKGPVLLVSGKDNAMWPATTMANMIERRAPSAERRAPSAERRAPSAERRAPSAEQRTGASGIGSCTCITSVRVTRAPASQPSREVRHPLTGGYYALGGTSPGNAAARKDSWPQVVSFLANSLRAEKRTAIVE